MLASFSKHSDLLILRVWGQCQISSILFKLDFTHMSQHLGLLRKVKFPQATKYWDVANLSRRAAVAVILYPRVPTDPETSDAPRISDISEINESNLNVLLTVRSYSLSYAGDVALPGGKADSESETSTQCALRETEEEVAIPPLDLRFVTDIPEYASSKLHVVAPLIFYADKCPIRSAMQGSPVEVADIFGIPLSSVLEYKTFDDKVSDLFIGAKSLLTNEQKTYRIWGLTANILIDCARTIYNRNIEYNFYRGRAKFIDSGSSPFMGNTRTLEYATRNNILKKPLPKKKTDVESSQLDVELSL